MNVVTLTDDNFASEVNDSEKPVLVDYWATWCGPCKMVGPIVEEIAIEFSDKIKVGKLDVDANQNSAAQQNVMSIPTLAIFKGGEVVAQQVGALSKTQLTEFIESMNSAQFKKVQSFFDTMPKLKHTIKVKNPKTKKTSNVTLSGLNDFFA